MYNEWLVVGQFPFLSFIQLKTNKHLKRPKGFISNSNDQISLGNYAKGSFSNKVPQYESYREKKSNRLLLTKIYHTGRYRAMQRRHKGRNQNSSSFQGIFPQERICMQIMLRGINQSINQRLTDWLLARILTISAPEENFRLLVFNDSLSPTFFW